MALLLSRPYIGHTAKALRHQDKLLRLLESNPQNPQHAALSAGISELDCGRQKESILHLLYTFP